MTEHSPVTLSQLAQYLQSALALADDLDLGLVAAHIQMALDQLGDHV